VPQNNAIAHVFADTAVYTGNRSRISAAAGPPAILDVSRAHAEAANLEVQIV
jgi:hypothetical protein